MAYVEEGGGWGGCAVCAKDYVHYFGEQGLNSRKEGWEVEGEDTVVIGLKGDGELFGEG